jgi:hypothetical protein
MLNKFNWRRWGTALAGGAVWNSTPVVDPKRHSLYVGIGNNYSVPVKDNCAR